MDGWGRYNVNPAILHQISNSGKMTSAQIKGSNSCAAPHPSRVAQGSKSNRWGIEFRAARSPEEEEGCVGGGCNPIGCSTLVFFLV